MCNCNKKNEQLSNFNLSNIPSFEELNLKFNSLIPCVQGTVNVSICSWITGLGGVTFIKSYDIMNLVKAYNDQSDIGFTVTSSYIMGCVAYYNSELSSGNSLTGCTFS